MWIFYDPLSSFSLNFTNLTVFPGKLKFSFKGSSASSSPFITLLQGRTNEIILRDPDQLQFIADAAQEALLIEGNDSEVLEQLKKIIEKKKSANGTKAQLKPVFNDEGVCEKVGVVVKWGGEVCLIPIFTVEKEIGMEKTHFDLTVHTCRSIPIEGFRRKYAKGLHNYEQGFARSYTCVQ